MKKQEIEFSSTAEHGPLILYLAPKACEIKSRSRRQLPLSPQSPSLPLSSTSAHESSSPSLLYRGPDVMDTIGLAKSNYPFPRSTPKIRDALRFLSPDVLLRVSCVLVQKPVKGVKEVRTIFLTREGMQLLFKRYAHAEMGKVVEEALQKQMVHRSEQDQRNEQVTIPSRTSFFAASSPQLAKAPSFFFSGENEEAKENGKVMTSPSSTFLSPSIFSSLFHQESRVSESFPVSSPFPPPVPTQLELSQREVERKSKEYYEKFKLEEKRTLLTGGSAKNAEVGKRREIALTMKLNTIVHQHWNKLRVDAPKRASRSIQLLRPCVSQTSFRGPKSHSVLGSSRFRQVVQVVSRAQNPEVEEKEEKKEKRKKRTVHEIYARIKEIRSKLAKPCFPLPDPSSRDRHAHGVDYCDSEKEAADSYQAIIRNKKFEEEWQDHPEFVSEYATISGSETHFQFLRMF